MDSFSKANPRFKAPSYARIDSNIYPHSAAPSAESMDSKALGSHTGIDSKTHSHSGNSSGSTPTQQRIHSSRPSAQTLAATGPFNDGSSFNNDIIKYRIDGAGNRRDSFTSYPATSMAVNRRDTLPSFAYVESKIAKEGNEEALNALDGTGIRSDSFSNPATSVNGRDTIPSFERVEARIAGNQNQIKGSGYGNGEQELTHYREAEQKYSIISNNNQEQTVREHKKFRAELKYSNIGYNDQEQSVHEQKYANYGEAEQNYSSIRTSNQEQTVPEQKYSNYGDAKQKYSNIMLEHTVSGNSYSNIRAAEQYHSDLQVIATEKLMQNLSLADSSTKSFDYSHRASTSNNQLSLSESKYHLKADDDAYLKFKDNDSRPLGHQNFEPKDPSSSPAKIVRAKPSNVMPVSPPQISQTKSITRTAPLPYRKNSNLPKSRPTSSRTTSSQGTNSTRASNPQLLKLPLTPQGILNLT